ncbi:hypothetical protein BIW11_11252 [Tropilaelaps mercedesae]|uniref:Leucine-rich PPR motif-containing protein n=1 Tax=Tropilaelaps mercedesae TaxID=418985 RepID=A0A1V9XBY8_9ACAR|nr:hypothetical protein BIW11_11252 [Tropilaelaps mercedesae]
MSSAMRMLGLASRVCKTRAHLAQHSRTLVSNCARSPARYMSSSVAALNVQSRYGAMTRPADQSRATRTVVDETLRKMDLFARRSGRVNLLSIREAIKGAQEQGRLSCTQTSQLLRATGCYLRECAPEARSALTDVVWKLADHQNLDISHYNALLQAYLDNGTSFDPQEFLVMVKDAGIVPNRVTYQRLIQRFCDLGDVIGATKVLEFMKAEQLPISEHVFNALVKGHLLAGDETSARKIIDMMGTSGLPPTGDTYVALACGLAETGETEKAFEAMKSCRLTDEQVIRVAKSFALKNNLESMRAATELMPRAVGFIQDVVNACLELLALKKYPAARIVFDAIPFDPSNVPTGDFFIAQMVRSGLPVEEVTTLCRELKEKNMHNNGIETALKTALFSGDRSTAFEYVRLMPEHGIPMRAHFFFPMLCKSADETELLETLRNIFSIDGPVVEETLNDFVLPRINFDDPSEVVRKLKDAGCALSFAVTSCAKYLLRHGRLEECHQLLKNTDHCTLHRQLAPLAAKAAKPANLNIAFELLHRLMQGPLQPWQNDTEHDLVGSFLNALPDAALQKAIRVAAETALPIGETQFGHLLKRSANAKQLSNNVVPDNELEYGLEPRPAIERKTPSQLEEELAALEGRGESGQAVAIRLLSAYCREKQVDKVEQMLQKLAGRKLPAGALALLIDLNVFKGDVDTALKFYREAKDQYFSIDSTKLISLATLAVSEGRLAEAKDILAQNLSKTSESQLQRSAVSLIKATVDKYGVDEALKMVDEYVAKFVPIVNVILSPIMRHVLESGDLSASVELFKNIASRYRLTPLKNELCLKLITDDNTKELYNIHEIATELYGHSKACVDLALAYVESGQIDKARALLQDLPRRVPESRVQFLCEWMVERGNVDTLSAFASLLGEFGYAKDNLYHELIRCHCRNDDVDKALEQWTKAQEENVILSNRTLRYLAEMLERNGREVPFVVPSDDEWQGMTLGQGDTSFLSLLRKSSLDTALAFREQAISEGRPLHMMEESELINALVEANQLERAFQILRETLQKRNGIRKYPRSRTVRLLLSTMAQEGMVEQIKSLEPLLNENLFKLFAYHDTLCQAYVCANRASEYLDILEKLPSAVSVGYGWANTILEKSPECLERILATAKRFASEANDYSLLSSVWMRFFADGDYVKADAMLADYPQILEQPVIQVNKILTKVRETGDVTISDRLLATLKNSQAKRVYALVLSQHIDVLVKNGQTEAAEERLKQECADGLNINLCSYRVLENLKKELRLHGKEAEFELPLRTRA